MLFFKNLLNITNLCRILSTTDLYMGHHIVEIMYGDDTTSQRLVAPIPARWESGAGNAMGSSSRRFLCENQRAI